MVKLLLGFLASQRNIAKMWGFVCLFSFVLRLGNNFQQSEMALNTLLQLCTIYLCKADVSIDDYELISSINSEKALKIPCIPKYQIPDQDLILYAKIKVYPSN